MKRGRSRGFTLVELLVVLAILGLLAGLLLPVLNQARERGRVAKCISNEKQLYLALKMYEGDYGQLPVEYGPSGNDHWLNMLQPYTRSKALFVCDSDSSHGAVYKERWSDPCSYRYMYSYPLLTEDNVPGDAYRKPKSTSPLILCRAHDGYQCIMCRYDGSIELAASLRYRVIQIEFE